jgi:hypothetical protein
MAKVVIVNNCGECPECGFNENHVTENWDKHFCLITGKDVELDTMPDDCPLPTDVAKDMISEIARLKEELRRYKFNQNSGYWHGKYSG